MVKLLVERGRGRQREGANEEGRGGQYRGRKEGGKGRRKGKLSQTRRCRFGLAPECRFLCLVLLEEPDLYVIILKIEYRLS